MSNRLKDLHALALETDRSEDWARFYQTFAGTSLIVPLSASDGDTATPALTEQDGVTCVLAYPDIESYASLIGAPGEYAEVSGVDLAEMLAPQTTALSLQSKPGIVLLPKQLSWIAETFGAEVTRATGSGVTIETPEAPELALMEQLGAAVAAMGADCPEAWLVAMREDEGSAELVLVLGLSDSARRIEGELAETVTRAVQTVTDLPFAVTCPDRGAPLMAAARKNGIGVGG
ncbi:MAG: SseB family protein [Pseudomonadota bacterium]